LRLKTYPSEGLCEGGLCEGGLCEGYCESLSEGMSRDKMTKR